MADQNEPKTDFFFQNERASFCSHDEDTCLALGLTSPRKASLMLDVLIADVSMYVIPFSNANCRATSSLTDRRSSKSDLLPTWKDDFSDEIK